MSRLRIFMVLVAAVAIAAGEASAQETIKIGAVQSMTGSFNPIGKHVMAGEGQTSGHQKQVSTFSSSPTTRGSHPSKDAASSSRSPIADHDSTVSSVVGTKPT